MRRKTLATVLAAAAAVLTAGSLGLAGTAHADPVTPQPYTAVGSNTTQDVIAALANQVVTPSGSNPIPSGVLTGVGSYEATPLPPPDQTITPNCGVTFTRPNGSGAGVAALSASIQGTTFDGVNINGCVQFARSSSGPSSPAAPGVDPLTYVPFARDAVGYIYTGSSAVLGDLTNAQLQGIYNGTDTSVDGVPVTAYIPQVNSGTRSFWETAIGVPDADLGANVQGRLATDPQFEENSAAALAGTTNSIFPFSISSYIAQNNGFSNNSGVGPGVGSAGGIQLGSPDGTAPTSSAGGFNLQPNSAFYTATVYGRDVYNVFPTADISNFENGTADPSLDPLLDQFIVNDNDNATSNPTPTLNDPGNNSGEIITDFGFLPVSYAGVVTASTAPTGPFTSEP